MKEKEGVEGRDRIKRGKKREKGGRKREWKWNKIRNKVKQGKLPRERRTFASTAYYISYLNKNKIKQLQVLINQNSNKESVWRHSLLNERESIKNRPPYTGSSVRSVHHSCVHNNVKEKRRIRCKLIFRQRIWVIDKGRAEKEKG